MTLPGTEPGNYRTASPIGPGHVAAAGCLRWRRVFPGREDQVRELRRWLAGLLPGAPARDDVVLVAVELVTNAVRHTASGHGGLVMVEVTWYGPVVRVAVADGGAPHGPQILAGPGLEECGRGLHLVHALAARTGVSGDHRGRLVWAEIAWAGAGPVTGTPPPRPADGAVPGPEVLLLPGARRSGPGEGDGHARRGDADVAAVSGPRGRHGGGVVGAWQQVGQHQVPGAG